MKTETKLLNYFKDGRIKKLKRYIEKHDIDVYKFRFTDGNYLLHKFCFYGLLSCIKSYSYSKKDFLKKNVNEELPIHATIKGSLQRLDEHDADFYAAENMIRFIREECPESFEKRDRFGLTGEKMLEVYENLLSKLRQNACHHEAEEDDYQEYIYNDDYECDDSYFDSFTERDCETYDEWADRMKHEHYQRTRYSSSYYSDMPKSNVKPNPQPKTQQIPKISAEKIKIFEENMKKQNKINKSSRNKDTYVAECEKFFKKHQPSPHTLVSFKDIPWPHPQGGTTSDIEQFLFAGMDKKSADFKALLKKQQVSWHPDRFMNRCESIICKSDRAKILQHVVEISQYFNALMSSL